MPVRIKAVINEMLAQKSKVLGVSFDGTQANVVDATKPGGRCASDDPWPKTGAEFHGHIFSSRTANCLEQADPFDGFCMIVPWHGNSCHLSVQVLDFFPQGCCAHSAP